jgi:hypothetical protein
MIQLSEAASLDRICHVYTDMNGDAIMVSETSEPRRLKYETPPWLQEVIQMQDDVVKRRLHDWVNPNPWEGNANDLPW